MASARRRHNSSTSLAVCRICGARTFLKAFRAESATEAERIAAEQFALARELFERSDAQSGFRVPRPLALHRSTIVMEYADAEPASRILRFAGEEEQDRLLEQIGLWFASYHRAMACDEGPADFEEKCEGLRARARGLSPEHPVWSAIECLDEERRRFDGRQFARARLHGDAKPDNFLVAGTKFYGIDVHAGFRNLVEYDLAQFLGQLLVSMASPVFRRPHSRAAALEEAVLRGYRRIARPDEDALRWLRDYFLVSLWLNAPSAGYVQRWLLRPLLLDELERQLGGSRTDRLAETTGDEPRESERNRLGRQYALPRQPGRP